MARSIAPSRGARELINAAGRGEIDETGARRLYEFDPEAVTLALLASARRLAEVETGLAELQARLTLGNTPAVHPATPSGMQPVYTKANRAPCCPDCGGPLQRCRRQRARIIEDIPEHIAPVVTEHVIHRDYCAQCKKHVEPAVPDALPRVDEHNESLERKAFSKLLRRLVRDAIRLRKRPDFTPQRYVSRAQRIDRRLCDLADTDYTDADAKRLADRLSRTRDHLWTFLDEPEVTFDNNFAERQIRPAVLLRKNGQNNRSERGAAVQSILMSVYRTLRLRGHNPMQTIAAALRTYLATGTLPLLPA